jgi:hypothetical protein
MKVLILLAAVGIAFGQSPESGEAGRTSEGVDFRGHASGGSGGGLGGVRYQRGFIHLVDSGGGGGFEKRRRVDRAFSGWEHGGRDHSRLCSGEGDRNIRYGSGAVSYGQTRANHGSVRVHGEGRRYAGAADADGVEGWRGMGQGLRLSGGGQRADVGDAAAEVSGWSDRLG